MSSTSEDILKSLCRLCAKQDKHCVNVFSNDGNKHFIQKKIRLCLPITIKENDVMPQQICLSCLNKLDTCYELYSGCVSAQSTIKKLIESSEEVSVTAISYPNPLIKVRKAVGSDLSPNSSPISLHDYLKQDYFQPKVNKIVSDTTTHKPENEENKNTPKHQRLSDSGYPRIKVRKLDNDITTGSGSVDRSSDQRKSTGTEFLVNNSLSTSSNLQSTEGNNVSTSNSLPTMIVNANPTDSSSTQLHLLPKISNLQSLAKPVSHITSTAPTTIMTSDSGVYQMSTQSINGMQPPQGVYLTSISDNVANPCTQILASPVSSTFVASQSLVPSPLITSTYITAPPSNTNQVSQTITPNYLIQQQPINSGTTSSALVYMNTLNPVTEFLPQNTSQHFSYTVSPAASNNNNILLTQELQKQSSSTLISSNFNKHTSNTAGDKTLTTATSSVFVSQTPVISNVQSLPLKTYERVKHVSTIDVPQTDSISQNVANSSALTVNNGSLAHENVFKAGIKQRSNDILQNLLIASTNSETHNQNIKNGNGCKIANRNSIISELNSQVSIHVPNRNSTKNDCSTKKYSTNKLLTMMANNMNSVPVPQSVSKNTTPPPQLYLGQKSTVVNRRSVNNLQPHIIASPRTSLDANSLSTTAISQSKNGPSVGQQAALGSRVYTHIVRPTSHSAATSTLPKNSTVSPAVIRKTSQCSSSASKSQVHPASLIPASVVSINTTTTASPTTPVNSVSAERLSSAAGVKRENEMCSIRSMKQELDSNVIVASSSTDLPGARSENRQKNEPSPNSENTCPYCHKYFPPDILIHHKVLHFRERFFSCIDCNKNFKTEIGLQTHRCEAE